MTYSSLSYPVHVSFASYTALSLPSPCERCYRLRVIWSDLTPHGPSGVLLALVTPTLNGETMGPPRFLASLFLRATLSDPDRPSGISPFTIPLCWIPRTLKPSPPALNEVTRLNRFGECGLPCGPQDALCTPRVHCSVIQDIDATPPHMVGVASIYLTTSFAHATLDRGGWLGLTPRGLSPRQRCQASLAH